MNTCALSILNFLNAEISTANKLFKEMKLIDFIYGIYYKINFAQDKVKGLPSLL